MGALSLRDRIPSRIVTKHLPNQQPFLFQGVGYPTSPCVEEFVVPSDLGYLLKVAQFSRGCDSDLIKLLYAFCALIEGDVGELEGRGAVDVAYCECA